MSASLQEKLLEYQESLQKIEQAITRGTHDPQKDRDYTKLKDDLLSAIAETKSSLEETKASETAQVFLGTKLKQTDVGRLCNAYYETDQQWYPAQITEVDGLEGNADVIFFGFNERYRLPFTYVQLLQGMEPSELVEGKLVEALYTYDGKWHPATIESVNGSLVAVRYSRWRTTENLRLDFIRESTDQTHKPLVDRDKFDIPEKLRIHPNDPEDIRKQKRKKVKALKKAWRQKQMDKASQEYQSNWKNFKLTAERLKIGTPSLSKSSIFTSPDTIEGKVGVVGSGKGVTHYPAKTKWKEALSEQKAEPNSD